MSNLYNVLSLLCEKKGISRYKMCKDTGLQPSVMTDLKMGRRTGLNAQNANKLATYFGVTVDYLLGNEQKEKPTADKGDELDINTIEYALYGEARELDDDEKQQLLELARLMRKKRKGSVD